MESMAGLCRRYTTMTEKEIAILERISVVFPFLADLMHGQLKVYVRAAEESNFIIVAQEQPHTVYMPAHHTEVGKLEHVLEEPLVRDTFRRGLSQQGKREWTYGSMLDMYTLPLMHQGKAMAVLSFEVAVDKLHIEGFSILLKTARDILSNAPRGVEAKQYQSISSSDGIVITDQFSRIIFANASAQRIYRVLGVGSLIGCHLFDRQLTRHMTREVMERETPWQKEVTAGNLTIVRRQIDLMEGGQLMRRIVLLSDVTEIRARDREIRIKSAVIQEIHHRVKNNLQTIASLLRLQARRSKSAEVKAALAESVDRVLSIAVVHEFLSQQGDEDIHVQQVMRQIFDLVGQGMADSEFLVRTEFEGPDVVLPSKYASSLALVLNELILNAMEHAFNNRPSGLIGLRVAEDNKTWHLDFYDDGIGLPQGFEPQKSRSLGISIVRTLIEGDLEGVVHWQNDARAEHGTHVLIDLPKPEKTTSHEVVQSLQEKE